MIFDTPEWKLVEAHAPIVSSEIRSLRASIINASLDAYWIINFAEAVKKMVSREEKGCPDYHYQRNYTAAKWSK